MKKLLVVTLLMPVLATASFKVESTIKVNNKKIERSHVISEGDHIVYPCEGMILDALVIEVKDEDNNIDQYAVRLKVVERTGATLAEVDKHAPWGQAITFECPSVKVTAELTMKVERTDQVAQKGNAAHMDTAAA